MGSDWTVVVDGESISVTSREKDFLRAGLYAWIGPGLASEELARAMFFSSANALRREANALRDALNDGAVASAEDWARLLIAAEIGFASDVYGAGFEWQTVTGMADEESLQLLRSLQRKLVRVVTKRVRGDVTSHLRKQGKTDNDQTDPLD